jgi:MCP family monocarboxylic acid transporter-like MFS transporter 10
VLLQSGSFLGRVLAGFLADKFGVWNVFVTMGLFSAVTLFALWTPTTLPDALVVIALILYGFGSGAWMTLVASSCAAISPLHEVGLRIGIIWTCTGPPALAGPVIVGGE